VGLLAAGMLGPGQLAAEVRYHETVPQVAFAAQEISDALGEAGRDALQVELRVEADATSPESFRIRRSGLAGVKVTGTDASGAMYGGLEVAERVRLGLPLENLERTPFVAKRGIKFNIPFDARTPSYDDTGDSAQRNIATMYDMAFWEAYLDDLARYRYNVLSLWTTHPYPSIVKLAVYPEVALDDVYRVSDGVFRPHHRNRLQDVDLDAPGTLTLVKKISMEEKIAHWQRVFQHAEDRGIEIYLFHWNVMTFGATGKHGITPEQTNPVTVDYLRQSVRQALLTYPQIKGIGVTAGENADNHITGEYSIENFLFNTYGRAMTDVLEQQPDRALRFIFRRHMTGLGPITASFADFPGEFNTSFKYAIGHMYTTRKPLLFDRQFRNEVEAYGTPCWFNLRNDDIFVLRWGSPGYVREYLQQMPHDVMPGFYMGSDGYVWGREFVARNPEMAGRLEIDKHWYRFRMWGQLAYDPERGRAYWEAVLSHRFPGVDAGLLYEAWAAVSEVIPLVNALCFKPNDAMVAPEGCIDREGFLTVDDYYFDPDWHQPMEGSGMRSVKAWGQAAAAGKELEGVSPLQVADNLDGCAASALDALPSLRQKVGHSVELDETLNDIESMAYLGRYYADKLRGAAKLAAFREDPGQRQYGAEAVVHLKDAVREWRAYAALASAQYRPQLLARTHVLDWTGILREVEQEVVTVSLEADYPDIRFAGLQEGERVPPQTSLTVKVDANDQHGIREVKLYLNGLLLEAERTGAPYVWSASSDELLAAMEPGRYQLTAVAEDHTGTFGRRDIRITVGEVSDRGVAGWEDQIHQVILEEGEYLLGGDRRDFPRLECDVKINDDGRLVIHGVVAGVSSDRRLLWKASMHGDNGNPHVAVLSKGQLVVYRGTPDRREATVYKTPSVSGEGPCRLGIARSRQLVLYREAAGRPREIIWQSGP
jgi:hypothetical protein